MEKELENLQSRKEVLHKEKLFAMKIKLSLQVESFTTMQDDPHCVLRFHQSQSYDICKSGSKSLE